MFKNKIKLKKKKEYKGDSTYPPYDKNNLINGLREASKTY